jgi:hypothetical protein
MLSGMTAGFRTLISGLLLTTTPEVCGQEPGPAKVEKRGATWDTYTQLLLHCKGVAARNVDLECNSTLEAVAVS